MANENAVQSGLPGQQGQQARGPQQGGTATMEAPRSQVGGGIRGMDRPGQPLRGEVPQREYAVASKEWCLHFKQGQMSSQILADRIGGTLRQAGLNYPNQDVQFIANAITCCSSLRLGHDDYNLVVEAIRESDESLWVTITHAAQQPIAV